MGGPPVRGRFRRAPALLAGLVWLSGGVQAVPAGSVPPAPSVPVAGCPGQEILPVDQVSPGLVGTGLTVSRGVLPEEFRATVLGVLRDEPAPGRSIIVVELSSPTIDQTGAWFGMSGSPVYFQGKLMGAVAFALAFGRSTVVGLTAAEDMVKVLDFPTEQPASPSLAPAPFNAAVPLPAELQRVIVRRTGIPRSQVARGLEQMKIPFAVSGISSQRLERIEDVIEAEGLPLVPYIGTAASGLVSQQPPPMGPGQSFAAALSYGDVTSAGIGTTTMVCPNRLVLAFGHPFFFEGSALFGANHARTISVLPDVFFGAFKLATVEETVGLVDQDRLAAIRAILGRQPLLVPVTQTTEALNTARTREGRTEVVGSRFVPFLTFVHEFLNIDTAFDQITGGNSVVSWAVTGTRERGEPWDLARSNMYVSEFDISFESGFELLGQLFTILENEFEDIEFTGVDIDVTVDEEVALYRVKEVLVSLNRGDFIKTKRISASRGDRIGLRVLLERMPEDEEIAVDLMVRIPRRARVGGVIEIAPGSVQLPGFECFFFGESCVIAGQKIESFDQLLDALETAPHNNELFARLRVGPRQKVRAEDVEVLDRVVQGEKRVFVEIVGAGGPGGGEVVEAPPIEG